MSRLWPRSTRTRPWSRFSGSKRPFSRNLKQTEQSAGPPPLELRLLQGRGRAKRRRRPVSQQEVVRFDVRVDDADGVQLLHHAEDAGGEVHNERLRHHLLTQALVDVHCILGAESQDEVAVMLLA